MAKRHTINEFWNLERRAARAAASRDKYQADKLSLTTALRDATQSRDSWKQKFLALKKQLAAATAALPPSTSHTKPSQHRSG